MRVRKIKTEMEPFVCHFSQVPDSSDSPVDLMCSWSLPLQKADSNNSLKHVYDTQVLVKFIHDPLDGV